MNGWTMGRTCSRVGIGVAGTIVTGLALTACGSPVAATSSERLDTRLVESLRSAGHPAPQGDGAAVLSTAARTTCGGEIWQAMVTRRQEPASTRHEAEEVSALAGDTRRFVALALGTYCP
jgi:hypothetical protein